MTEIEVQLPDADPATALPALSEPAGKIDYVAQAIEDALMTGRGRGRLRHGPAGS